MDPKLQDKYYEVIQKVRFGLHPAFGVPHLEAPTILQMDHAV